MTYELDVDGEALRTTVARIVRITKKAGLTQAILSFDGELVIELPQAVTAVPASGDWPGRVFVAAHPLMLLLAGSTTDTVQLAVVDGWLAIGGNRIHCRLSERPATRLTIPLNATTAEVMSLRFSHTDHEIADAGLAGVVAEAEERYRVALTQALKALTPLEVTMAELREFADASMKRRYGGTAR